MKVVAAMHRDDPRDVAVDRLRGRRHTGTASAQPLDPAIVKRFNRYGQSGPKVVGWDPLLVRIELDD